VFEEPVELRVSLGIVGGFEQRTEQIVDQFLKVVDQLVRAVDVAVSKSHNQRLKLHKNCLCPLLEAWHLDQPADVSRLYFEAVGPFGQSLPFLDGFAVNGEPKFGMLIFTFFQISHYFLFITELLK
jgi:hypothetical protein